MRLTLGRLGSEAPVGQDRPIGTASFPRTGSQRRARFAWDSEVSVARMTTNRTEGDWQRKLAGEQKARQRTDQVLAEAQAIVASLQAALARSEQAARVAWDTVEDREAAIAGLRAEPQRVAAERNALQGAQVAATVKPKPKRVPATSGAGQPEPDPVRWWPEYLKARSWHRDRKIQSCPARANRAATAIMLDR
ncbi:MAG: hypothetical protein ACRYHQ_22480 [Janthinobacterium lividum]